MLFPTFDFFAFFTIVLILNWLLKKNPLAWRLFLLAASYFFYSLWEVKFLFVLIFISIINFSAALIIQKSVFLKRKILFILVLLLNVLALWYFKYYDFFRVSTEMFLQKVGFFSPPLLEIILPIGLSFYILRAVSYLVDIYIKKTKAEESWVDFFLYLAFFPHILAGPIARAKDFLPQLKNGGAKYIDTPVKYFTLIFLGFFKKVVISSFLTIRLVDSVLAVPENYAAQLVALAVFCYSLVIYCDFSGYSDMAIGFAGLLGFKPVPNFNFPYLASNLRDFWRRWHISLSFWIRDYIYIPLGGNRVGKIREHLNLLFSMIVAGLWHGAALNFIIWGGIHGLGISLTHFLHKKKMTQEEQKVNNIKKYVFKFKLFVGWLVTFSFTTFAWIFFRSENLSDALDIIKTILAPSSKTESVPLYLLIIVGIFFLFVLLEKQIMRFLILIQEKLPIFLWFIFVLVVFSILFKLSPYDIPPFIYFSF